MREAEVVQKNLKVARMHEDIADLIRASQLEEVLLQIKDAPTDEFSHLYESFFGENALSSNMLRLCKKVCENRKSSIAALPDTAIVATVKNPLALSAVRELAKDINTVRIADEADFRASCEAVISDRADYCILPVCSSLDGYYPTFSKLMKAYELKMCRCVRISKPDSDEELQFALLSKSLEIQKGATGAVFSFAEEDKNTLPKLISAFYENGIETVSVRSTPLEYNMDRFEHRIEITLENITPEALLFFLDTCLPGHTVLGIYR